MYPRRFLLSIVFVLLLGVVASVWRFPDAYASVWAQTAPRTATVLRTANLRGGPGTSFAVVGKAQVGQTLTVVGANADSSWYQLDSGAWIAAFLVKIGADAPVIGQPPPNSQAAQVTDVIDGDTIEVDIAGKTYPLRYILIDTPERGQPFATEATAANQRLVAGKTVYLVKDVNEIDRYNRLLRYVYLADGTFVNAELVRQGYAVLATFPPDVAKEAEIRTAQQEAVAAGRGLWLDKTPAAANSAAGPTANDNANLRSGPGTTFAVVGGVKTNQALEIVGQNADRSWYQLRNGAWINAALVDHAPTELAVVASTPVVAESPTPTPTIVQPAPAAPAQNCDPSYPTVCIAPAPPDLDCPDIPYRRFQVIGADPHRFDGDHDGVGCER